MDRPGDGNLLEIIDLAHSLRQEHLYITNEQKMFRTLNATLQANSSNVAQLAWICAQQRQNLNSLIVSRADTGPSVCCHRANQLANTKFIDAHKARGVKYQHVLSYIELFNFLHRSPYLLAQSLTVADRDGRLSAQHMSSVVHTIVSGLYGNAILSKDVDMLLRLLRELIEIQIVVSENPRHLLRSASASAFSRLYHRLHESLFSAKLFLTSALHESIMRVLIEDDQPLDVDPQRTIANLPAAERARRFGLEGTGEFEAKCTQFRAATLRKLHRLTAGCLQSLLDNWTLFPSTLRWVVQTMCHLLKSAHIRSAEINHILTDMVFTHFICPAVVSPDLFGISDAPVSENARHNLIQIGQVMQMLALTRHEPVDARFAQLLAMFEHNVVAGLMEQLQETEYDVSVSMMAIPHQNDFGRDHVLVTQTELNVFVAFLRSVLEFDGLSVSGEDRRKLGSILDQLPDRWETVLNGGGGAAGADGLLEAPTTTTTTQSSPTSSAGGRTKQSLISLGKTTKTRLARGLGVTPDGDADGGSDEAIGGMHNNNNNTIGLDDFEQVLIIPIAISDESKFQLLTEQEVLNMNNISTNEGVAGVDGLKKGGGAGGVNDCEDDGDDDEDDGDDDDDDDDDDELRNVSGANPVGVNALLLRGPSQHGGRFVGGGGGGSSGGAGGGGSISSAGGCLPLDDQSIGNASDNLEAVSEVPSNHSVSSSVEMEEHYQHLNDNLSDMVSANVSGRGSPNISGRDTPSSQVTDGGGNGGGGADGVDGLVGDGLSMVGGIGGGGGGGGIIIRGIGGVAGAGGGAGGGLPNSVQMAKMLNKTRSDIDDKFCKFEISKRMEVVDETVSIISDTWSTDVLASDSETLEPSDAERAERNFATPLIPSAVVLPGDRDFEGAMMQLPGSGSGVVSAGGSLLDASETRSESAWSTDVLASDSEKLIEIDTDDNNSVTANSDTAVAAAFRTTPRMMAQAVGGGRSATAATTAAAVGTLPLLSSAGGGRVRISSDEFSRFLSPLVSGAGPSGSAGVMGAPQVQLPLIGAYAHVPKPSCMRRQNSAESSISTQSSTNENEAVFGAAAARRPMGTGADFGGRSYAGARVLKTDTNIANPFANASADTAATEMEPHRLNQLVSIDGPNDVDDDDESLLMNAAIVEQRVVTTTQRSTSYDGRRNGIMSPKVSAIGNCSYENHEIIFKARAASMNDAAAMRQRNDATTTAITDDDKSQRQQQRTAAAGNAGDGSVGLVERTLSLSLAEDGAAAVVQQPQTDATKMAAQSRYTGTIPKSISFDESANKQQRSYRHSTADEASHLQQDEEHQYHHHDHHHHHRQHVQHSNSFFNKLKQGFRNQRNRRSQQQQQHKGGAKDDAAVAATEQQAAAILGADALLMEAGGNGGAATLVDGCEDILAKYRRKISSSSEATNSDSLGHRQNSQTEVDSGADTAALQDETPLMMNNAKRKLRLVLSTTDLHTADFRHTSCRKIPPLMTYLQIQLAQALNLQHMQQIAFISETIRCLRQLDDAQQRQLIADLQLDLVKRQSYLQYLMRYRQHLLSALENIDRFEDRLRNDRDMCNRHLIMVCVRLFLEKRQSWVERFQEEFGALTVVDEKIDCMEEFMGKLMAELLDFGVLQGMTTWQRGEVRAWIERALLQKLYRQVMFPNDDADVSRDEVLRIHIAKLSRLITPAHTSLRIPHEYRVEAPWPFAQQQIAYISAYKTPREKVQCVVRCITSIMNLLQMACSRSPAADDLVPVLIFVVIKANPPYLMSTIQYVNAFIGNELEGEDLYWWTQFSAAVTFIKTMDYNH